ncbi:MAG: substrate-binding domain-containing protein [Victivallales bacterium]|nr:substrate-binding domain-containing protein [Victivallales bacterium]
MKKYEQAIDYLMKNVLPNLSAGDKIPPETQLAKEAGVCLMTLRRGVDELCLRGILSRIPEHRAIVESSAKESSKQINVLLIRLESDVYYTEILLNLQQQMLASGRFKPMLHSIATLESPRDYEKYFFNVVLDMAIKNKINVVLVIPGNVNVITIEKHFAKYGISLLTVFGEIGDCHHQIMHDLSYATYYGLYNLYVSGCRHLFYLGNISDVNCSRWTGVKRFFNEFFPMEDPCTHAINILGYFEEGFKAFKRLMEKNTVVDGIQAHNDEAAAGIIAAAKEHGIRIPEQLSVVGIDNLSRNTNMKPRLTSFAVPIDELIREIQYALEQLAKHDPAKSILRIILYPMMHPGETIRNNSH